MNRKHPGSFQKKLLSSSFKWVPEYILLLVKLNGEGRTFWDEKHRRILSYTGEGNRNYYKSVHHLTPTRKNRDHPGNLQNKSVSSLLSVKCSGIFSSYPDWREEEGFFRRVQKGGHIVRLMPKALGCHDCHDHEMILPLLYFLLDPFTNKYCRTWSSMINLWIDSRTCQKERIVLSTR